MGMFSRAQVALGPLQHNPPRSVAKTFSLKHPGPLDVWARDLLGVQEGSVTTPYKQSVWVYRCINLWLRVAQIPLVYEDSEGEPVDSGNIAFLLRNPNTQQTQQELMESLLLGFANYGEWFLLREDGTNFTGVPTFLRPVSPRVMTYTREDIDRSTGLLKYWRKKTINGDKRIDARGVIQGKLPNPFSPYRGLSPLVALRMTVDADFAARMHNKWQMQRHGRISNLVTFDGNIGPENLKTMKKLWDEKYSGAENAGETGFLDNGARVNQLSLSMKDMDWLQGQKISREEICAAYGIPPNNAGILDKATYSNFEQSSRTLWEDTLVPVGQRVTSKLQKELVEPNEPQNTLSQDFKNNVPALQADQNELVERYKTLVTNKVSPRQAAMLTGINLGDEEPAHDVVWVGLNELPAEDILSQSDEPEPEPEPEKALTKADIIDAVKQVVSSLPSLAQAPQPAAATLPGDAKQVSLSDELRQARGRTILREALPFEKKLRSVLKRFFFEQRSEVLKNFGALENQLKRKRAVIESAEEIADNLFGKTPWAEDLVRRLMPTLRAASKKGAEDFLADLAAQKQITEFSETIVDEFHKAQAVLLAKVQETTRQALQLIAQDLIEGLQTDATVIDLADSMRDSLKGVYNNTQARRIMIARTESLRALNGGRFEQMRASGAPKKEWLTVRDGEVRESHIPLDKTQKPIGEEWTTADGNKLMFPHDPSAPPGETVNCRCTLVAVFA